MSARALVLALAWGCGTQAVVEIDLAPVEQVAAECHVCGMLVAQQPSPRAQLVYRDGTRAHFCSLGDLRASVAARSPHGEPQAIYVEALPVDLDPAALDTAPRPWVPAESAGFLYGLERPQVMGLPLLSYADPAAAHLASEDLGLSATTWVALSQTPFNALP